jgi:sulfur-oxidizing protein SoxY
MIDARSSKTRMNANRRHFVGKAAALLAAAWAARVASSALAADALRPGFAATTVDEALKGIGAANPTPSKEILIKAPDVAENGAAVPIEVTSRIAGTESITILADKNPHPLVASFGFTAHAEPYVSTRIKLRESSNIRVLVRAGGRHYVAVREVRVTQGGCA